MAFQALAERLFCRGHDFWQEYNMLTPLDTLDSAPTVLTRVGGQKNLMGGIRFGQKKKQRKQKKEESLRCSQMTQA